VVEGGIMKEASVYYANRALHHIASLMFHLWDEDAVFVLQADIDEIKENLDEIKENLE